MKHRIDDMISGAEARLQRRGLVAAAAAATDPRPVFEGTTDRVWWWANTAGYRDYPELRRVIPALPDPKVQRRFTGASGDATLRVGHQFHMLVRDAADTHVAGGYAGCTKILDFGCGWGRVIRFFTRHFDSDGLVGIDCVPAAIGLCRATDPWARFEVVDPLPPTSLSPGAFDLIYSFSVFSHLNEDVHLQWIDELHRLLRPRGLLVVTTRPRSFMSKSAGVREARDRGESVKNSGASRAFMETAQWEARYDAGEFCHDGVGGGDGLDNSFYGETLIPRAYAERAWQPRFNVVDFISDRNRCPQDVIIAVRGE